MTGNDIPRDEAGRVRRPKPSQLLADVMEALGPDHLTTRTLMAALIERDAGVGVEPRAVTPVYGWHLPVLADVPNVPYDMQELALDIEGTDTGWRNINALLVNGWSVASGYVYIRRAGHVVNLRVYSMIAPGPFNATFVNPIPGFMGTLFGVPVTTPSSLLTNTYHYVHPMSGFGFAGTVSAGAVIRLNAVYLTTDAWPGTLPGAPALLRDALPDVSDPFPEEG